MAAHTRTRQSREPLWGTAWVHCETCHADMPAREWRGRCPVCGGREWIIGGPAGVTLVDYASALAEMGVMSC